MKQNQTTECVRQQSRTRVANILLSLSRSPTRRLAARAARAAGMALEGMAPECESASLLRAPPARATAAHGATGRRLGAILSGALGVFGVACAMMASRGVGDARARLGEVSGGQLSQLADVPCLAACEAGPTREAVARLANGTGTCETVNSVSASDCFAKCDCFGKVDFNERRKVLCATNVGEDATHATMDDELWTTKINAKLKAECSSDYQATGERTDEEIQGHEVVGNELDTTQASTNSTNSTSRLGAKLFPRGYSDVERAMMASAAALGEQDVWRGHVVNGRHTFLAPLPNAHERAPDRAPITFKLYTQCKTREVKVAGGEFWFSAPKAAYIVRHNFESDKFFTKKNRIKMERKELSDGLYGYEVTTSHVDFEYGFELENAAGNSYKDIGASTTLRRESCVQRYGEFFNRVVTLNRGQSTIGAVFGDCDSVCPEDYVDEAYCRQPFTGEPGTSEADPVDLGLVDDARLINMASALLYSTSETVMNPSGRAETFRQDAGSKSEQKWIIAASDYYRAYIKMVQITIRRDPASGRASAWISGKRRYTLRSGAGYEYGTSNVGQISGTGCGRQYCNTARYDIPSFYEQGVETTAFTASLTRMEYTKLSLGDAPPTGHNVLFEPNFLTSPQMILAPGAWGEDMDVRRLILKNGVMCGRSIHSSNCMFGKAFALKDTVSGYSGPSKTRKDWLFIVVEHVYFKMIRVAITLGDDDAVNAEVIAAGYVSHIRVATDLQTSDSMAYDGSAKWNVRSFMDIASNFAAGGYGLGGFKFDLAAEMSASLRAVDCGA